MFILKKINKKGKNFIISMLAILLVFGGVGQIASAIGHTSHLSKVQINSSLLDRDGIYEIDVKALKENSDSTSMANKYLNSKAQIKVSNGGKHKEMTLTFSKHFEDMEDIEVNINGRKVPYKQVNEIKGITFEIPNEKEIITISMKVKVMIIFKSSVTFRVVPNQDSIRFIN
ncbi:NEAT domain-containing protein [Inediibacterium massiliense]|uniref:NEAT domain-containing protein n=1 Tax=Inediibacterium massiliense TaxID=1658111 RepID=UPI0006B54B6C|nr:NEAT domain-containing protein [Inediibacterium massiliense]